jgi:hypothetical protein
LFYCLDAGHNVLKQNICYCGPRTPTGQAAAARNNFRHGLAPASAFWVLQPATTTEEALVQAMAEHHWLRHRALRLEESCFDRRYQTTHERAFHKALNDLPKLRAEKRKAEIGFERQQHIRTEQTRKQEKHEMAKERLNSENVSISCGAGCQPAADW